MFVKNAHFKNEIERSPEVRAILRSAASQAAPIAERYARQVMPRRGRRRIEVVESDGEIYLVNTNYGAAIEEWGTSKVPAYAPLRRGVSAAGFRFADQH